MRGQKVNRGHNNFIEVKGLGSLSKGNQIKYFEMLSKLFKKDIHLLKNEEVG